MLIHAATLSLIVHPAVEHLPVRQPDSMEGRALRNSIAEIGIIDPLQICKGRIVDGRERWLHAKALGKNTVPCIEIPETDVQTVVLSSLLTRKHFSKSALTYLAYPFAEPLLAESRKRRLANLKTGEGSPDRAFNALSGAKNAEDVAESLGINRRDLFTARNIHGHFEKDTELKAHFEPLILSGEMSLSAVSQGIAGWTSTKDKPKGEREQLVLWQDKIRGFCDARKFAGWAQATAETRAWVREQMTKGIRESWPDDLRHAIIEELINSGGGL